MSDNGTQFVSVEFNEYCEKQKIKQMRTPAYHSQLNGLAKRFIDTLKRMLTKLGDKGKAEENLDNFFQTPKFAKYGIRRS